MCTSHLRQKGQGQDLLHVFEALGLNQIPRPSKQILKRGLLTENFVDDVNFYFFLYIWGLFLTNKNSLIFGFKKAGLFYFISDNNNNRIKFPNL